MKKTDIINYCDRISIVLLYAIAFFFPISKAMIEIFSGLMIVCFALKKILESKSSGRDNLSIVVFTYLALCFFSIFISTNIEISYRTFFGKVLQDVLFFFAVAGTLSNERRVRNFLYILFCSSLVLGVDGIFQYFTHKDFIRQRHYVGKSRIHATFPTPNDYACYLYAVMPFVLVSFFTQFRKKIAKFLLAALFILLFICLLLTISRGGWFAFITILLFMSVWLRPLGVFLLVLGIFVIITRQFYYPDLKERLSNFFFFLDSSTLDRSKIWQVAWNMFMTHPVIGLGIGTFMFNFNKFLTDAYIHGTPYAHNCYLQIAVEIGVIGLVLFLAILAIFFWRGIRIINTHKRSFSWYVLLAAMAAIVGYCVQMSVDTIFYSLDLGILFWLLLGIGTAAMNLVRKASL